MLKICKIFVLTLVLSGFAPVALAQDATGSDTRIRTFIYGKNDVFRINTVYGYQTLVELDPEEKIMTMSIGNPSLFRIIPTANRMFIKALINNQLTNMTLITDKRIYQIELSSYTANPDDLMYVVRFAYPDGSATATMDSASQPMSLYSPLKISQSGSSFDLPSMPSLGTPNVPLSIQYNQEGYKPLDRNKGFQNFKPGVQAPTVRLN